MTTNQRGLAADAFEVVVEGLPVAIRGHVLVDLAVRHREKRAGEQLDHPHVVRGGHKFGRVSKHVVAHHHRGAVAEQDIRGGLTPAGRGVVDHVVMDQRGRVQ